MKPLVFDLFCGLGGWSEAFLKEGYRAIGFDIEAHDYGKGGYPGELVVRDIRSITGTELVKTYGVPNVIVASPPCQEFSYMAMPWSKAKEKRRKILADPAEQTRLKELFNECFRIQREVSDAAGRYVPLIVENVRGAQEWVGKAKWNFGSFYLWGDVPALMPIPSQKVLKSGVAHRAAGVTNFHGFKTAGMNCSEPSKRGQDFTRIAGDQGVKNAGHLNQRDGHSHTTQLTNPAEHEGVKQKGICGPRRNGKGDAWFQNGAAAAGSKSSARKEASAMIAKIPAPLAQWIARTFKQ
jgi:hypothetical protein